MISIQRSLRIRAILIFLLVCIIWMISFRQKPANHYAQKDGKCGNNVNENRLIDTDLYKDLNQTVYTVLQSSEFINKSSEKLIDWFRTLDESLKNKKNSIFSFLSQPIINDQNFSYLHNLPTACDDSKPEVLIVVPSAPENFEKRDILRKNFYGNYYSKTGTAAKLVFFLGFINSSNTLKKISEESSTFYDIVQHAFEDSYHNITFKAVSMLEWSSRFCQGAKYVIRNDDDIIVNLTSVAETVKRASLKYANFIIGQLRINDAPSRNNESKVYLSELEYPEPIFPPYALGGLLGYPMLTVELLYQAALRVKPIWLDDVYITGICAPKIGAELITDPIFRPIFPQEY